MSLNEDRPFSDLPAALVEEILGRTEEVGEKLLRDFRTVREKRSQWREGLAELGLLRHFSDLPGDWIPTTCGIDGSYAIERLLTTDFVAAAAVAVEGLTPPSEKRYWEDPYHRVYVGPESHHSETSTIARALMIGMEIELATNAPHEIIFIDGSFTTPLIFLNQALNKLSTRDDNFQVGHKLLEKIEGILSRYLQILDSRRTDRIWVAAPKYSTLREIGDHMKWPSNLDDRGLLSSILNPGEYTLPMTIQKPAQPWHLGLSNLQLTTDVAERLHSIREQLLECIYHIQVFYFRPRPWLPALRLEINQSVAENPSRLGGVLYAVLHQCQTAAIMEPYPLYMADRMVKSLAFAMPTFRQVASQRIAITYEGDVDEVFFGLHGYRTDSGR